MPFSSIGKGVGAGGELDALTVKRENGAYTASTNEHIISDGGEITLPAPEADALVMVSKYDEVAPVVKAGVSSIDGNPEMNLYEAVPTIFISDGSGWYTTNLTLADFGLKEILFYIEDDFDDNSLTNRTNPDDGVYAHPDANEAGDVLIGRYRPEWEILSGSPAEINNQVEMNDGDSIVTPSDLTVGLWSCDFTITTSSTTGNDWFVIGTKEAKNPPSDSYQIFTDSANFDLTKRVSNTNTILVSSSWTDDNNTHREKVTRDSYSNFEYYLDGTSKGTATDSALTDWNYFMYRQALPSKVIHDNLVVQ